MIWGKTYKQMEKEWGIPKRVFAYLPHRTETGEWVWLDWCWLVTREYHGESTWSYWFLTEPEPFPKPDKFYHGKAWSNNW